MRLEIFVLRKKKSIDIFLNRKKKRWSKKLIEFFLVGRILLEEFFSDSKKISAEKNFGRKKKLTETFFGRK